MPHYDTTIMYGIEMYQGLQKWMAYSTKQD